MEGDWNWMDGRLVNELLIYRPNYENDYLDSICYNDKKKRKKKEKDEAW